MKYYFLLSCVILATAQKEWVWKDETQRNARVDGTRYLVQENLEDLDDVGPVIGFRPQNTGPYTPDSRPIVPGYQGNKGVLVGPGGPTGITKRPYYPGGSHGDDGHLDSGFLPPWIKDDPRYREYDTCRCRYSFNCPTSALKFGNCSKDKKYCCFNSRKYPALVSGQQEGHRPSYPGSPHKYGPVGFRPTSNFQGNRRPQGNLHYGQQNPHGNYHFSREDTDRYPRPYDPYDRRDDEDGGSDEFDFYSRSLKQNQTDS